MIHRCITDATPPSENAFVHKPNLVFLADTRAIIEELRVKRGFPSVRALAIAAGVPQPTLSRYLTGKTEAMEVASFKAIAEVLDVTVSELIGEVPVTSRREIRELAKIMDSLAEPEREALLAAGRAMSSVAKRQ